jgi:uncharacterized protein (TIGR04255 family)
MEIGTDQDRMDSDFVYENPPLGEVVAELFWKLTPLASMPGAAVDPFFEPTLEGFSGAAAKLGFAWSERIIPVGVPLELLAGQPVSRFRQKANSWPLYQLGAGVFTCNVVPPYGGWSVFRDTLAEGVEALFEAFPAANIQLKVDLLRLRYINGFDAAHGYRGDPLRYIQSHLGLKLAPPTALLAQLQSSEDRVIPSYEMTIPTGDGSEVMLKTGAGQKNSSPAVVLELWVTEKRQPPSEIERICRWYDTAHKVLHDTFEFLLTEQARKYLGKKLSAGT